MTPWSMVPGIDIDGDNTQTVIGSRADGDIIQHQYRFMRGQPAWYLGSGEVAQRLACYVPAGNHDQVVRFLQRDRAIVLTGRSGSGRSTTAIAAMNQILPGIRIRRFLLDQEDIEEIVHADAGGYIVRAADGRLDRLDGCADAVRDRGGYLAVIADDKPTDPGAVSLSCVRVEPPPPLPVYRRWVAAHHRLPEWASWERASALLPEDALPADARRLADLAADVNEKGGPLEERQEEAAQAYQEWDEELRGWFKEYPQPQDRALLIAAATLPSGGASEGYVYAAASLLAGALRVNVNGAGLAWCPVTGLRTLLGVSPDDSEITFHRTGFACAVLRHALADYPLALAEVLDWLSQLPTGAAGEYNRANEVAETFADLAAEHGAAEHVRAAVRRWGEENSASSANLAFIALSRTSLHPRIGGRVRQALYDWSRNTNTPQTLKRVIAQVCGLVGREYPSVALTRLKHLVTRGNSQVLDEVIATSLALADVGHRRAVTAAALQWCAADASGERLSVAERRRRRRAGATLFLELASAVKPPGSGLPAVLAEAAGIGLDSCTRLRSCAQGWRAVFDFFAVSSSGRRDDVEATMCLWLDGALDHDAIREQVCELLVAAASPVAYPAESASSPLAGETVARIVIGIVQRWAALDHTDMTRADMERRIVIRLTSGWWLRLVRTVILNLRAHRLARSRHRGLCHRGE